MSLLQEGGAERSNYFSDFVTHLVAGYEALESDISAAKDLYEIPAVTQNWILCSVKCNKLLPYPFINYNTLFSSLYIRIFPFKFYVKYCFLKKFLQNYIIVINILNSLHEIRI